jgi:hypothetical protein
MCRWACTFQVRSAYGNTSVWNDLAAVDRCSAAAVGWRLPIPKDRMNKNNNQPDLAGIAHTWPIGIPSRGINRYRSLGFEKAEASQLLRAVTCFRGIAMRAK